MKVLLTGSTGFVGSHILPALLKAGHEVQAILRPGSDRRIAEEVRNHPGFSIYHGDVTKPESLEDAGEGCDAVMHLVGIIEEDPASGVTFEVMHVEATQNIVRVARRIGAKRFVHMSALGAREFADSDYHRTKYHAESIVRYSGIPSVIFRPSLIFGPGDGFVNLQKKFIYPFAFVVVPGSGKNLFQPVFIGDVVEGFIKALTDEKAAGKIYEVGGPARISFNDIVDLIAEAKMAIPIVKLHPPFWIMRPFARIMHAIFPGFPVNVDQVVMLQEDNTTDSDRYFKDFEITGSAFTVDALKLYI